MGTAMHATSEFINQPVVLLLMAGIFVLFTLRSQKIDIQTFITAINSISSQPFALIVLAMGFGMLIECKKWSIDTTIAGGVIGVASNMLQSQIKDASGNLLHQPAPDKQPPAAPVAAAAVVPDPNAPKQQP